jgi:hypothetical protein
VSPAAQDASKIDIAAAVIGPAGTQPRSLRAFISDHLIRSEHLANRTAARTQKMVRIPGGSGFRSDQAAHANNAPEQRSRGVPNGIAGSHGRNRGTRSELGTSVGAAAATGDGDSLPFRSGAGAARRLTGQHRHGDDVKGLDSVTDGDALLQSLSLRSKSNTPTYPSSIFHRAMASATAVLHTSQLTFPYITVTEESLRVAVVIG